MNQADFEALINDELKTILCDINWTDDDDHYPCLEFKVEVDSIAGYPIFVKGSFNPLALTLSYTIVHSTGGRIYALDLGKDHRNPDRALVGETHKHRWTETFKDEQAYVPPDITAPVNNPVEVWNQFCAEAKIAHRGRLNPPPAIQEVLL